MLQDIRIQFRRSSAFYAIGGLVAVLLQAASVFCEGRGNEVVPMAADFYLAVLWLAMCAYAAIDLYNYYCRSADLFLLLAPGSRLGMMAGKAVIHAVWFFVIFVAVWPFGVRSFRRFGTMGVPSVVSIAGARLVGILAWFSLLIAVMALVQPLRNRTLRACMAGIMVVAVIAIESWVGYELSGAAAKHCGVSIIIGDSSPVVPQYINILPVTFEHMETLAKTQPLDASVSPQIVAMNAATVMVCALVAWLASRRKADFLPNR